MKIQDAKVIVCSPGRNFVTLKLITQDGIYGVGTWRSTGASWQRRAIWTSTWYRP